MAIAAPYWPWGAGPIIQAAADDSTPANFYLNPGRLYCLTCDWAETDTAVVGKFGGVASAADAHFSLGIRHYHFFTPRPGYTWLSVISISGAIRVVLHSWTPAANEGWWAKQLFGIDSAPVVVDVTAAASAGVALDVGGIYRISGNCNMAIRLGGDDVIAAADNAHHFFHAVMVDIPIEAGYDYLSAIRMGAIDGKLFLAKLSPVALPPNREMRGVVSQFDSPQPIPFMGHVGTPTVVTYSSILAPTLVVLTAGKTYSITAHSQMSTDEAAIRFGGADVVATATDAHFVTRNHRLILRAMPSYSYLSVQGLDAESTLYISEVT
jgi:hypothetical protein